MRHPLTRLATGLLGAGALALGLAVPAGAHVSPDKDEVPAGGYTSVTFTVGHGCDDSPTREVAFRIPEGILNASPQVLAGWDVATATSELEEAAEGGHGTSQTERVSEITWTAQPGNELDPHFRQVFTIGFRAPEAADGPLAFPVIQRCVEGEIAWVEETVEGEAEPESPAPFVTLGAPAGGHGGSDAGTDAGTGDEEATGGEAGGGGGAAAAPGVEASSSDDGGGSSNGLSIVALIVGLLGLAAGGTALLRSRAAG